MTSGAASCYLSGFRLLDPREQHATYKTQLEKGLLGNASMI